MNTKVFKIIKGLIGLIFLSVLSWHCQTHYQNENLDTSQRIPVVEGSINNTGGPHIVSLYYARPYNTRDFEYIMGANVVISDSKGNSYQLKAGDRGTYITEKDELIGVIGETYSLRVTLPGGTVIESKPAIMPDTIGIEKVVRRNKTVVEEISRNYYGNPMLVSETGTGIFATLKNVPEGKGYYRLSASMVVDAIDTTTSITGITVIEDSLNVHYYDSIVQQIYHCYSFYYNHTMPRIGELFSHVTYSTEDLTHFMYLLKESEEYYTDLELYQWIIFVRVHSMSPDNYTYYDAQLKQLNAQDRIFDPIPAQIIGNLYLPDDPQGVVLGMFEVSSLAKRNFSIYIVESMGLRYQFERILPDTITIEPGCYLHQTRVFFDYPDI